MKKNLYFYSVSLLYDFSSLKKDVIVPSKRNTHKNMDKRNYFYLASLRSLTKRAGSGAGSVSQKYGSEDPYPHPNMFQKVTDPEHW
jgi:hypothetical protein